MQQIIPTAEPFLFPGSRTGCLLVHGYTGAPKEMRWLGEFLAAQGFSVLGIRLPGHATHIEDMARTRWTDWVASVEDGYHILRGLADRIYMLGLSMGGVLSLLMSTRLDVKGVVAISTPWKTFAVPLDSYLWLIGRFWRYAPKSRAAPGAGWVDQDAYRSHISYKRTPVTSVAELNKLLAAMRRALPEVRVPVLLIHSQQDRFVASSNTDRIYQGLSNAPEKIRLLLGNSGHVVTRDAARQQAFDATLQFILRQEAAAR